ncbi:MAG: NAD(+) synthase [Bacteroidetes bacterium]|nr:NAD(+) synthase [Bacteroidota bacterium]MBS1633457.1 NAD(+) synthase [Bacteroidota bacterium]
MNLQTKKPYSRDILLIDDIESECAKIALKLKNDIFTVLKRRGAIVGISGGIDSSVSLALTVKAIGPDKVTGIMLPEKDSSDDSKRLALQLAAQLGVKTIEENISAALNGIGCYKRRDEAVTAVFPEYNPEEYTMKIGVNPLGISQNLPPVFSVSIIDKKGSEKNKILPPKEYLQIVAASNFKQRMRMSMLYYHAESNHYAVIGTPNKHEYEQGFFVKYGDGGADVLPIVHLYKTQVYQLAKILDIPKEIIERTPTSDTYSAEQTQEEFFFQLPFKEMDLIWYGYENGYDPAEVSAIMNKTEEEIQSIYKGFLRKQKTTEYLRMLPISSM